MHSSPPPPPTIVVAEDPLVLGLEVDESQAHVRSRCHSSHSHGHSHGHGHRDFAMVASPEEEEEEGHHDACKGHAHAHSSIEEGHSHSHEHDHHHDPKVIGRLKFLLALMAAYVFAEMTVSAASASLALLADAVHNLSDVISLYISLKMQITVARAQQEDDSFPYGQRRAEVVGGLVNAVSLCALSLYITLGAVPLLASPEEVNATWVYIAVAGCGIAVNLVGVYFFLRAGLGCSHTHSLTESPSRTHHEEEEARASMSINGLVEEASNNIELLSPMSRLLEETKVKSSQSFPVAPPLPAPAPCSGHHHHNHGNMNLWAVAVHSAVDSFSSLVICLMGLMMRFMGDPDGRDWTDYLDPCTAILLAGVSVYFAWPIVAETIRVVMEGTPRSIQPSIVKKSLMCVGGVQAVEDLAVTQLSASYKVASVRLVCSGDGAHSCGQVLKAARSVLLGFGIDRSTIEVIDLHHHVDL